MRDTGHPDRACMHTVEALRAQPPKGAHLLRHHAIARSVSYNTFTNAAIAGFVVVLASYCVRTL